MIEKQNCELCKEPYFSTEYAVCRFCRESVSDNAFSGVEPKEYKDFLNGLFGKSQKSFGVTPEAVNELLSRPISFLGENEMSMIIEVLSFRSFEQKYAFIIGYLKGYQAKTERLREAKNGAK